ncbi:MAG: rne [Gammaproteobacteria bacterium]|jgi:ribonuclease E|nr:rne [Gammaproteobacteria bacterium]
MKKMLINATRSEELRVAIIDDHTQSLLDVIVERQSYRTTVGNIYLAKVSSIEKSLGAAFINFGSERHGFLPMKEISKEYFEKTDVTHGERPNIKELIKEGQYLMVQVEKEERGNKGAALTTFISLAGSYLVLMPNNPRAGGISRRVEGEDRSELRDALSGLPLPEDMGLIVRTAGVGRSTEELEWDLNNLLKQWNAIKTASLERDPPFLIHQESDIVTRIIRDYLREDFSEIVIDNAELFAKVKSHIEQVRPDFTLKVKLYTNNTPIFNHYQIEQKIESAYQREVQLPSGGSIVIDHTEALVAIDVNSARANKGSNIEETALTTNMEAAEEIARQLRLRDIGGLVVIDFIDMSSTRNRRDVENHLRNSLKLDKARTQIGNVSSRFGLLEMSRQRLRHSLGEATQVTCPRCSGWGTIRGTESLALSIIRMIEDDAVKTRTAQVQAQLPIDIATFIINEKRGMISDIEKRHNVEVLIIPNQHLESPHYNIKRLTQTESAKNRQTLSYLMVEKPDSDTLYKKTEEKRSEEKPAVVHIPSQPAPTKKGSTGLIKRLIGSLFRSSEEESSSNTTIAKPTVTNEKPPTPTRAYNKSHGGNPRTKNTHHSRAKNMGGGGHGSTRTNASKRDTQTMPHSEAAKKTSESFRNTRKVEVPNPSVQETKTVPAPISSIPADVLASPSPHKQEAKPITTTTIVDDGKKEEATKPRTRRGTRGGRRRTHSNNANQKQITESANLPSTPPTGADQQEVPLDFMPPFPSDLEDYYKQSINKTAPKFQKTTAAASANKPAGSGDKLDSVTEPKGKLDPIKEETVEKQQKTKSISTPEAATTQNMTPIIVKMTPLPPKKDKKEDSKD